MCKRIFFIISIIFFIQSAFSQINTQSPYSRYGIGEPVFNGLITQQSIGRVSQGYQNSQYININNPASLSGNHLTTFEVGAYSRMGILADANAKSGYNNADFNYMALAFPLSQRKRVGFAIGLMPLSHSGYKVRNEYPELAGVPAHFDEYIGTGGLNKVFAATGFTVFKKLNLGAAGGFAFGSTTGMKQSLYNSSTPTFNYRFEKSQYSSGLTAEASAQFRQTFKKTNKATGKPDSTLFTVGLTYSPQATLASTRDILAVSFKSFTSVDSLGVVIKDTIAYETGSKSTLVLPSALAFGIGISKPNKYFFGADISTRMWSSFRNFGLSDSLSDEFTLSLGASYIPKFDDVSNYFNRVEYRAGFRYSATHLIFYGQQLSELGLSLGASFPMPKQKSKLNLGLEFGRLGTQSNNLVQDTYLRVAFGVTLQDKWFNRYKIQ